MTDDKPKTRTVLTITRVAFMHRIGRPHTFDADAEYASAEAAVMRPELHPKLGPGLWLTWKDTPNQPTFIPSSNIARISYTEREEPIT